MRAVNIMNFVRAHEPREEGFDEVLLKTTELEIKLVKEFGVDNTFLLQYDAVINNNYIELFRREQDEKMELGLWLEIVQPLCEAVGLPWRSERGYAWDWHVVPGFSMAYTEREREMLIDEAMRTFKKVYGFYPRTVGSWLIDTHTANYLAENYEIDALCICRDQVNTDAYTLVGGYFNNMYYPSKNNIFTPAQTEDVQIDIPVIRLLTADPIHTYDMERFMSEENRGPQNGCFTFEPVWKSGKEKHIVDWYYKTYFKNENLGFSYMHIGQENSFGYSQFIDSLRKQIECLMKEDGVSILKMRDTGKYIKANYEKTPTTVVYADDDWCDGDKIQSLYYNTGRYVANLFRYENRIFIRSLYLFDEKCPEHYLDKPCETWDAIYENLPVIDTIIWDRENAIDCGMTLDTDGVPFEVEKLSETEVKASWQDKSVIFREYGMEISGCDAKVNLGKPKATVSIGKNNVFYNYNTFDYSISIPSGNVQKTQHGYDICRENGKINIKF